MDLKLHFFQCGEQSVHETLSHFRFFSSLHVMKNKIVHDNNIHNFRTNRNINR